MGIQPRHSGRRVRTGPKRALWRRYRASAEPVLCTRSAKSQTLGRVLLTRDVGLLNRSRIRAGLFIRAPAPRRQLKEVVQRTKIADEADPFSRCLSCNAELQAASPQAVDEQVPPRARAAHEEFVQCPSCDSGYWAGTHVERMRGLIDDVTPSTHDDNDPSTDP